MLQNNNSPADEYALRLKHRSATHARLAADDERLSRQRLTVFALAAAVAWLAWGAEAFSPWVLVPVAAVFAYLVRRHDRVIQERDAAARAVAFYERGLARLADRWAGNGEPGDRFADDHHLYATDLDLFGRGSLFELLSIARTRSGEDTLAAWLKTPADPGPIRERQQAVAELTARLDLREALALAGTEVRAAVNPALLIAWAAAPGLLAHRRSNTIARLLTTAVIAAAAFAAFRQQWTPLVVVLAIQTVFAVRWRSQVTQVLHAADHAARDLDVLAHVLAQLERERFESPRLSALRRALGRDGVTASQAIRQLHRLAEMHDWQHNQFFAPIGALLLWGTHLAHAIERWRARHGAEVGGWLEIVGEFEAISSLACYRYEHPDDVFPEIVEQDAAAFEGSSLAHPLLPSSRAIRNDVHLSSATQLLVVSGSNMSGKSTLLRTIGINAVLAYAGAPVRASRLRLTPLAIGATLRIQDSLQEGRSRFFAEITRIRRLADVARQPPPLLFLLDELFHGTNSHDRLVGATGVLRGLAERGAIGLITTHDLALTRIADDLAPRATNVHFEDTFDEGEIRFDYRIKPGPVTRSNALALMRAVGLDVD